MASFQINTDDVTLRLAELFKELCVENLGKQYPYAPGYNLSGQTKGEDTKINTGRLRDSINIISGDGEAQIEMEDYGLVVNFGRRNNVKRPPMNVIEQWIQQKGITPEDGISRQSLAYLIARSIGRKGIAPTNFIDDAIGDLAVITLDPEDPRNPFNEQDVTDEVENFINNIIEQITQ